MFTTAAREPIVKKGFTLLTVVRVIKIELRKMRIENFNAENR